MGENIPLKMGVKCPSIRMSLTGQTSLHGGKLMLSIVYNYIQSSKNKLQSI